MSTVDPAYVPIAADDLRASIVRPALHAINLWTPAAEDLLVGTAIQESELTWVRQRGGGPALGYWQMEPATHDDCWTNFLASRTGLGADIRFLIAGPTALGKVPPAVLLETVPRYACAMARIRYYRSAEPIPAYGDVAGYARVWKRIYNTPAGAGTEGEFIANWHRVFGEPKAA